MGTRSPRSRLPAAAANPVADQARSFIRRTLIFFPAQAGKKTPCCACRQRLARAVPIGFARPFRSRSRSFLRQRRYFTKFSARPSYSAVPRQTIGKGALPSVRIPLRPQSFVLPSHGIMARSRFPTASIGWAAERARMSFMNGNPALFSSIQARANRPD